MVCQSPSAILLGRGSTRCNKLKAKSLQSAIGWRVRRNWHAEFKFTKAILFTLAIGMISASTTKLFKIVIKNIK